MGQGIYYGDYLKLKELTSQQRPLSNSHDEMLFIVVHQVYELWFKQILHELERVHRIFSSSYIRENDLSSVVQSLERITKIQNLFIDQFVVLETMTPMDFLEFRDLLIPASGFQSVQFREIEVLLGLGTKDRQQVDTSFFMGRLSQEDKERLKKRESEVSFYRLLEKWLERMPFTNKNNFNFWQEYKTSVENMLQKEKSIIANNPQISPEQREFQMGNLRATETNFKLLLSREEHLKMQAEGKKKLGHQATLSALFIFLYREEPILGVPFKILTLLLDIDENFTSWRYRHALLAQRMLGTKVGTGGTSGQHYLKMAAENNQSFKDLFDLSTFLLPRSMLPVLPQELKKELNFFYANQ